MRGRQGRGGPSFTSRSVGCPDSHFPWTRFGGGIPVAPMQLTPGTRLGPYEVLGPLGAGGMGRVFRARDVNLDRPVAVKVLREDCVRDPEWLARFDREARLLATLSHPNIATVHGLDEVDGLRYLVMELVPGETLARRLAGGPLPTAEALAVA